MLLPLMILKEFRLIFLYFSTVAFMQWLMSGRCRRWAYEIICYPRFFQKNIVVARTSVQPGTEAAVRQVQYITKM